MFERCSQLCRTPDDPSSGERKGPSGGPQVELEQISTSRSGLLFHPALCKTACNDLPHVLQRKRQKKKKIHNSSMEYG